MHTYILTYLHTYIPTYLHTYIPTYIHTYIHTYMHTVTYMYACMHACMHAGIHTYLHTCRGFEGTYKRECWLVKVADRWSVNPVRIRLCGKLPSTSTPLCSMVGFVSAVHLYVLPAKTGFSTPKEVFHRSLQGLVCVVGDLEIGADLRLSDFRDSATRPDIRTLKEGASNPRQVAELQYRQG